MLGAHIQEHYLSNTKILKQGQQAFNENNLTIICIFGVSKWSERGNQAGGFDN